MDKITKATFTQNGEERDIREIDFLSLLSTDPFTIDTTVKHESTEEWADTFKTPPTANQRLDARHKLISSLCSAPSKGLSKRIKLSAPFMKSLRQALTLECMKHIPKVTLRTGSMRNKRVGLKLMHIRSRKAISLMKIIDTTPNVTDD